MNHPRTIACLSMLLTLIGIAPAGAENWPGWRGPNRTGVTADTGAPISWSPQDAVRWKAALPGSGISNPIVWNDLVICTSSDGAQQRDLHVIALDRDSGRERWHARCWGTAPTLHHGTKSSMASPSPITDGTHVYAFFGTGDVFCLDLAGRLLWQRSLAEEYGAFENRFAASSSPLLFEDLLILQCDHYGASYLLAIDKHTGADRWKVDRPETWLSWSSPVCTKSSGADAELLLCGSQKLDGFVARTGEKLWTVRGLERECIPTPIVDGGRVYLTSGPKGTSYAVRLGGRGDVTESHVEWTCRRGNPFVPSAILLAGRFFLVDDHGIGSCLDAASGKTLWRKRFGGDFTASPVAAENRVYLTNETGSTLVLAADSNTYSELARNEIGEAVYASPAISAGRFFLRTTRHLWCLGAPGE